ncbi:MAG: hypothetical protein ABIN97_18740, partial [Ginsengibacter sp.]
KLIISFPKEKLFKLYKIRYSLLSTIAFCILFFGVLQSLFSLIFDKEIQSDLIGFLIFFFCF